MKPCRKCGSTEKYKNGRCAPCTRASNQRWKANNREKHREGSRRWAQDHPEEVRAMARRSGRKNRARVRATSKAWRQQNPDKHVAHEHKRRAAKKKGGTYSTAEWHQLCELFENKCLRCGQTDKALTIDHVIPLCVGGMNTIENIQPLCGKCNSIKGARHDDYRISWMNRAELAQAIPPAYTHHLGTQLAWHLEPGEVSA